MLYVYGAVSVFLIGVTLVGYVVCIATGNEDYR